MTDSRALSAKPLWDSRLLWFAGVMLTGLAYTLIFSLTRNQPILDSLRAAGLNCASLAASVIAARAVLRRWLIGLDGPALWVSHLALAAAFSVTWAWLLFVVTGIATSGSATRFSVTPFLQGPAQLWQMMQGLFAYAAVAALTVLECRPGQALLVIDNAAPDFSERFLLKANGDVLSLMASDIVSVMGADDYAEIVTLKGNHLVPTTLAALEAALDPRRFVRVHRSTIANLDHVVRAEPVGGGRLSLSMVAGPNLSVSRTGARLLRERAL
ncbi:LytR/AlgR family response regulator transcription factor [Brevundimonas variabilis]|uniref:HTH LytTR-type domain-containing protein n=1 Tax=Brevundimonas variabilis TaxID=74312 RepID=A0A7W9CFC7_9CAUL|nr:LytTR family DNA-binding domain-containing protein [Brevundimonas variabilis]MBB5744514.1 hypothetical protein [Brevundimonas variabilis]